MTTFQMALSEPSPAYLHSAYDTAKENVSTLNASVTSNVSILFTPPSTGYIISSSPLQTLNYSPSSTTVLGLVRSSWIHDNDFDLDSMGDFYLKVKFICPFLPLLHFLFE